MRRTIINLAIVSMLVMLVLAACTNDARHTATLESVGASQGINVLASESAMRINLDQLVDFLLFLAEEYDNATANIVRVEVLDERVDIWPSEPRIPCLVNRVRVLETFVGAAIPGDVLEVFHNNYTFAIGEHLVLFLLTEKGGFSYFVSSTQGAYRMPHEFQATQNILESATNRTMPLDMDLQPVNPNNNLALTLNDLLLIHTGDIPRTAFTLDFNLMDSPTSPATPSYIEPIMVPFRAYVPQYLADNHPGFPVGDPTRPGYDFAGWYRTPTFDTMWLIDNMPQMDTTWYARWQPTDTPPPQTHTITFNAGTNGTFDGGQPTITQEVEQGGSIMYVPQVQPNNGWEFAGWHKSSANGTGGDASLLSSEQVMALEIIADTTFAAQYTTTTTTDQTITINFPGFDNIRVAYWHNNSWTSLPIATDSIQFTPPAGTTIIRVDRLFGGAVSMQYSFLLANHGWDDRASTVLDVPISTITVTGVTAQVNLAIVQSTWVHPLAPATVGTDNMLLVFDNDIRYEVRVVKPGFHQVTGLMADAGDTVDIGHLFYDVVVPDGVTNVRISNANWVATNDNVFTLKQNNTQAWLSFVYNGVTHNRIPFMLDGTNPFDGIIDTRPTPSTFTLTYHGNGHEFGNPPPPQTGYQYEDYAIVASAPLFKSLNHARFGWTVDSPNSDSGAWELIIADGSSLRMTANHTLYARWFYFGSGFSIGLNTHHDIRAFSTYDEIISPEYIEIFIQPAWDDAHVFSTSHQRYENGRWIAMPTYDIPAIPTFGQHQTQPPNTPNKVTANFPIGMLQHGDRIGITLTDVNGIGRFTVYWDVYLSGSEFVRQVVDVVFVDVYSR